MGYVLVENGTAVPYSIQQLREAYPNTSFPKHPSADSLAEYNVFPLNYDPQPDFDIVEAGAIEQRVGGEFVDEEGTLVPGFYGWWQSWTGRNKTAEEKRTNMIVTMRQARLALAEQGLLSQVQDAISLIPEPDKTKIEIEWEYASEVDRNSSWVSVLQPALGVTDEQIDDLFILARTL